MFEVKVTVELPGIPEAINNLADALRGKSAFPAISTSPAIVNAPAEKLEKNEKPALTPVEPAPAEPPLTEVPATEPEPSFIGDVPPDEPAAPAPALIGMVEHSVLCTNSPPSVSDVRISRVTVLLPSV